MDRLWRWVQTIKRDLSTEDWDSVVVIDGGEGSGKSTLALIIKAIYEGAWSLDRVIFDPEGLIGQMEKAPVGSCVLFDEAILGLYKRDWHQDLNRTLAKAFSIVRARNLLFLLCIPNYYDLDAHLRHRCQYRWYVYVVHDRKTKTRVRGHSKLYYSKKDQWMSGDPWLVEKFRYRFPALPQKVYDNYRVEKMKNIGLKLEKMRESIQTEDKPKVKVRERVRLALLEDPDIPMAALALKIDASHTYVKGILKELRPNHPKNSSKG